MTSRLARDGASEFAIAVRAYGRGFGCRDLLQNTQD
jgi:hypothetical protein